MSVMSQLRIPGEFLVSDFYDAHRLMFNLRFMILGPDAFNWPDKSVHGVLGLELQV